MILRLIVFVKEGKNTLIELKLSAATEEMAEKNVRQLGKSKQRNL